jgi:hypothetical protein
MITGADDLRWRPIHTIQRRTKMRREEKSRNAELVSIPAHVIGYHRAAFRTVAAAPSTVPEPW